MRVLIFPASHRPESFNRKLVMHTASYLRGKSVEVDFAEYSEFDMPLYNDSVAMPKITRVFAERARDADGIVISAPEYNWSYPGSLKNIIDWTSCLQPKPLKGKTALIMSASPGQRGGILGLDHLKAPLEALQLHVFNRVFALGNCQQAFDDKEALLGNHGAILHPILDDYVTFTRKLTNS